ncbi:MAG: replication initiator protein A [Oscillospiraceae bacterium]|nr:replication initiator protein A [Oscillospiraceae bacterium]
MTTNYFYGKQADRYSFIWIPKTLMTEKTFSRMQSWAKITYGFLMDRMRFSLKNHWVDEDGLIYVIYPLEEIQRDMGITRKQAAECLSELECAGLLERKALGPGLPDRIYLKSIKIDKN